MSDDWNFQLEDIQAPATGIDSFFESNPEVITPLGVKVAAVQKVMTEQRKIGSLSQLKGFVRIASDALINKSTNDLWALRKNGDSYVIERLFQDGGKPLKG